MSARRRRRRRRRNPGGESYWIGFGLAASAVVGILYIAKTLAGASSERMRELASI